MNQASLVSVERSLGSDVGDVLEAHPRMVGHALDGQPHQ